MPSKRTDRSFGDLIYRFRRQNGWSLREAARRIGMSHSRLDELEKGVDNHSGKPLGPTYLTVIKIARGYELAPDELLRLAGYTPEIELSDPEWQLVRGFRSLPPEARDRLCQLLAQLQAAPETTKF